MFYAPLCQGFGLWLSYYFVENPVQNNNSRDDPPRIAPNALQFSSTRKYMQFFIHNSVASVVLNSSQVLLVSGKITLDLDILNFDPEAYVIPDAYSSPSKVTHATKLTKVLQSTYQLGLKYQFDNEIKLSERIFTLRQLFHPVIKLKNAMMKW